MQALVLAAGKGTRMRSSRPKVLHEIFGRPMLGYVLETLGRLGISKPVVVIGSGAGKVRAFLKNTARPVVQREQRGSGHAVMVAEKMFRRTGDDILIWPGDMPLLTRETLAAFIREHRASGSEVSVLSALMSEPEGYGRILRAGGRFYAIREELDATEAERRVCEVNTGVYLFRAGRLFEALKKVRPTNRKKEFYLTDTIEIVLQEGCEAKAFPLAGGEAQGINSRGDLAEAHRIMNGRQIRHHQQCGVTVVAPDQTFVAPDVRIGADTVIYPWCYIESGVRIGSGCQIGPFAKIRQGSVIGDGSVVGSFVEVNRSRLGKNVTAKHLAYLGDAVVRDGANIGAGTITANYDGKRKQSTRIGKKVLIGSNTVLVAPVTVPDGVKTGAGAVLTRKTKMKKGDVVVGVPARALKKKENEGKRHG